MVWQKSVIAVVFFVAVFLAIRYLPIGEEWVSAWSNFVGFFRSRKQDKPISGDPDSSDFDLGPDNGVNVE